MNRSNIIAAILVGIFVALIVLGMWWVIWQLWMLVVPAIWTTAPDVIARPGFWMFLGTWFLLAFLGRFLVGNK